MGISFPFPDTALNSDVEIYMSSGIDHNGASTTELVFSGKCYYEQRRVTNRTQKGEYVNSSGVIIVKGDLFAKGSPVTQQEMETGYVIIRGKQLKVTALDRYFNLSGTVHHVELEVI